MVAGPLGPSSVPAHQFIACKEKKQGHELVRTHHQQTVETFAQVLQKISEFVHTPTAKVFIFIILKIIIFAC